MKRVVLGFIAAVVLAACAAHEKTGDRAAAIGDWKSAYMSYRAALAEEPGNPELKAKYEQARDQALQDTQKRAHTCAQVNDWGCALAEADFALSIDGGNAEIAAFRANAATQVALGTLDAAADQSRRGQFGDAAEQLQRATKLSQAPEVKTRAEEVRRLIVTQGRARADAYRKERNLIEAHGLAQLLLGLDGSLAGWAQGIATEYEQFVTVEYERLAREGDAARAQRNWGLALERYQAALNLRQGGRAAPLAEYVGQVGQAEQRMMDRNWEGAANAYRNAVSTGQDDGHAAQQLERVQPRPYRVAVRSVMVVPTRPDGNAWVGVASPFFLRLANRVSEMAARRGMSDMLLEVAMSIPHENRPQLRVEAVLPDGLRLTTPPRPGIYTGYDSELVILSNAFDDRRLAFQVFADLPGGSDLVGSVDVAINELVEHRDVSLQGRSVISLKLAATRSDGREPGSFSGMAVVQPQPPPGPPGHAATPVP